MLKKFPISILNFSIQAAEAFTKHIPSPFYQRTGLAVLKWQDTGAGAQEYALVSLSQKKLFFRHRRVKSPRSFISP
jgi:hypothetical protein